MIIKRIISIIMLFAVALSLSACAENVDPVIDPTSVPSANPTEAQTAVPTSVPTETPVPTEEPYSACEEKAWLLASETAEK